MFHFPMHQQRVARVCVDAGVVLLIEDGSELRLSCPFNLADGDGNATVNVDPEALGEHARVVVGLVQHEVAGVDIEDTGQLRLRFSGGGSLTCRADARYEAWTLTSSTHEMFVCQPGGGVAHWPPAVD